MNDATDRLTIKANLTLSKEEIIDRIVDMEMDPLRAERNKAQAVMYEAKQVSDGAQVRFNGLCASLAPRSLLQLDQQVALDKFLEAFKLSERNNVGMANLQITGKLMSCIIMLTGEDGYHQLLTKLVNAPTPPELLAAYDEMHAKRAVHQEAQQVYSLAASKCDSEAEDELRRAIKHRLVDNLFKEINGSLQKLLAAPRD